MTESDPLRLISAAPRDRAEWWRYAAAVESAIAQAVVAAYPTAWVTENPDEGADVTVRTAQGEPLLALEVKLWRASPKNLPNRLTESLSAAVLHRRRFAAGAQLALVVVVAVEPEAAAETDLAFLSRLERLIRRDQADAGFDRVLVGLTEPFGRWFEVDPTGEVSEFPDFAAAMSRLSERRLVPERASDTGDAGAAQPRPSGLRRFLLVCDEWESGRGGISTINRELSIALAAEGCDVCVVVPSAADDERDDALTRGVTLVTPDPIPGVTGNELMLTRPRLPDDNWTPDVVVGHGRVLGPYAYAAQNLFFPAAKRLHVVHTDAERLEIVKGSRGDRSAVLTADERQRLEVDLALSADLVAGIGPLLSDMIKDAMRGARREPPPVVDLRPGLRDWGRTVRPDDPPTRRQVLLIARADDLESKGIDIAAKAVARAIGRFDSAQGDTPVLVVRGVPRGRADEVKAALDAFVAPETLVVARPYSADVDTLRGDLWQSRLLVMPSRHEGFGLVALEAIAAGVPVLVSRDSGLGRVLRETVRDGDRMEPREVLPVPADAGAAAEIWGDAIYESLVDPTASFARAAALRHELGERLNWSNAVKTLLAELEL